MVEWERQQLVAEVLEIIRSECQKMGVFRTEGYTHKVPILRQIEREMTTRLGYFARNIGEEQKGI